MTESKKLYWWSFKTEEHEYRDAPTTDEEAMLYIPQIPAAQGLYQACRMQGHDILGSMAEVLKACIGEK